MNRRNLILGLTAATALPTRAFAAAQYVPVGPSVQGCSVGIPSSVAFQIAKAQEAQNWCWAACISMLFHYAGHPVSQETIVATAYGRIVDLPATNEKILAALNRPWTDEAGQVFHPQAGLVDLAAATNELAAGRPLIVGTLGHAMLLTAMDYRTGPQGWAIDRMTVRDPYPYGPATNSRPPPGMGANGRRTLSVQEFVSISFLAAIH